MPKVNVFLPEVAPLEYQARRRGWFSGEVDAGGAGLLERLLPEQDWSSGLRSVALLATGRGKLVVNDIVTLHGVTAGGRRVSRTRTWNGERWIGVRGFVPGSVYVEGSVLGGAWASNQSIGRRIGVGQLTAVETAAGAVYGQHAVLGGITVREISNVRQFITNSIQIGPGRITLLNLHDSIRPAIATRAAGLPLQRASGATTWRRVGSTSVANFRRSNAGDRITMNPSFNVSARTAANPGAFVRMSLHLRARIGTTPTGYSASTIYSQYNWTGTFELRSVVTGEQREYREWSQRYTAPSGSVRRASFFQRPYLILGFARRLSSIFRYEYEIPAGRWAEFYFRVLTGTFQIADAASFSGEVDATPSDSVVVPIAHSPINANRYIFLDGYYTVQESRGSPNRYTRGGANTYTAAVDYNGLSPIGVQ